MSNAMFTKSKINKLSILQRGHLNNIKEHKWFICIVLRRSYFSFLRIFDVREVRMRKVFFAASVINDYNVAIIVSNSGSVAAIYSSLVEMHARRDGMRNEAVLLSPRKIFQLGFRFSLNLAPSWSPNRLV